MLYVLLPPQPQLYAEAEKQQKMAKRKDYYKILGVDQSASTRDIKTVSELTAEMAHVRQVGCCFTAQACSLQY